MTEHKAGQATELEIWLQKLREAVKKREEAEPEPEQEGE